MTKNYSKKFASSAAGFLTAVFLACPALAAPPAPQTVPTLNGGATNVGLTSISSSISGGINTETVVTAGNSILNWTNFDIGNKGAIDFAQQSSANISLNRITGSASEIYGSIKSNGKIILVNQNGLNFRDGSYVNVGGLIATTSAVSDPDGDGKYNFTPGSNHSAKIFNKGIIVANNGLAALVAPNVTNEGVIVASLGKVVLASGDTATAVDFYGDGLINLSASDSIVSQLIKNSGTLSANGGEVTLKAAKSLVDSLINTTGLIQADTVGTKEGKIVLLADNVDIGRGDIYARGEKNKGEFGGTIDITGRKSVKLCCADVNALGVKSSGDKGQITITTDTLTVHSDATIHTNDNVTFKPYSLDRTIGVAGAAGGLQITTTALNAVLGDNDADGVQLETITIGNTADTGLMTVNPVKWNKSVSLLNGTGNIEIVGKQYLTKNITFLANTVSGDIILGKAGRVYASSSTTGTPIILAASGGSFINNYGPTALTVGENARWLVYTKQPNPLGGVYDPEGNVYGDLDSHNNAIWATVYDGSPIAQPGNRYVFAYAPTVVFTLDDLSKLVGTDATAAVAADTYTVTGLMPGQANAYLEDTLADATSGTPDITSPGSPPPAAPGLYPIDMTGVSGINGYSVAYVPGTLTVTSIPVNNLLERTKAPVRRGPYGTLLAMVNTAGNLPNLAPQAGGTVPAGNLADLAPKAGGDMDNLADLSPQAGGPGITPLIQCTEATPCDINQ